MRPFCVTRPLVCRSGALDNVGGRHKSTQVVALSVGLTALAVSVAEVAGVGGSRSGRAAAVPAGRRPRRILRDLQKEFCSKYSCARTNCNIHGIAIDSSPSQVGLSAPSSAPAAPRRSSAVVCAPDVSPFVNSKKLLRDLQQGALQQVLSAHTHAQDAPDRRRREPLTRRRWCRRQGRPRCPGW